MDRNNGLAWNRTNMSHSRNNGVLLGRIIPCRLREVNSSPHSHDSCTNDNSYS
ncbi:hypothetical protein MUK42_34817 [Musa troglodytarum]|uniref:Uncharacterized protein n=1 Tax=Musa troglodytarum TaxID=320322 RepID=A0A9E7J8F2_9LILI|nr:hypothetical protein MUK42_34817 [Musa troglodytarum]